jgi:hypothetical protein
MNEVVVSDEEEEEEDPSILQETLQIHCSATPTQMSSFSKLQWI